MMMQVAEVNGEDVVRLVKNSVTLSGLLYTLHVSQIHINLPTLTDKDKEVISSWGFRNNIDILSLSYTRHAEDVRHILPEANGVILSRGNLGIDLPPEKCNMAGKPAVDTRVVDRSDAILLGAETLRGLYPMETISTTVVAALASDPNVWNAVWENKALQELLQSQNANKEYVADNESVGDTDSQDAAVSSKKLTELSDDESETGNSQTGLMDVINNVKLTVVDMVTNVSAYFKKIFSFSSAEHTPDAADENAGSSTTEKTLGASLMALAVMILQEADGVILSLGNLGIDLPPEKCNMAGKPPVITRVVDSMTENLRPTRAEATDVASAILDGSDAILLGAETLRGLYPMETISTQNDESIDLTFKGVAQQFNKVFFELVQGGHGHLVMMKKKMLIMKMIIVTMIDVMKQI
ncbi:hypothetical protein NC651_026898 [Populus alba x Populus x berolinensis]|nr:hypothetical protein NC651_026898 [Populus alba x Populus x berolinensis]